MAKLKQLYEKYRPKRWYSWQTTFWLSGISGLMSLLTKVFGKENGLVSPLLASCGWIFLIIGISWVVKEERSTFAPWITGAVVCIFFFGSYSIGDFGAAVATWPLISAVIYALPFFWDESLKKKIPTMKERITILLVLGSQLLLSFWIQFFLVLSDFIVEYPSYYSDNLSESLFVVRPPTRRTQDPRGVFILDLLDRELMEYYQGKLWSEVDAELKLNPAVTARDLFAQVQAKTVRLKEDVYWSFLDAYTQPKDQGYELVLQDDWIGPQAKLDDDYRVEKICNLQPTKSSNPQQTQLVTSIGCGQSQVFGWLAK
jgi:hypothetical protein